MCGTATHGSWWSAGTRSWSSASPTSVCASATNGAFAAACSAGSSRWSLAYPAAQLSTVSSVRSYPSSDASGWAASDARAWSLSAEPRGRTSNNSADLCQPAKAARTPRVPDPAA